MNIYEAAKQSQKTGKPIIKKDGCFYRKGKHEIRISPTNEPDCCIVKTYENGQETKRFRCWNPQMDDLTSENWEIAD